MFRPALRYMAGSQALCRLEDWAAVSGMKEAVLSAITAPPEVSSIVIKFAEILVIAYVPGKALGPYAQVMLMCALCGGRRIANAK